MKPGPALGTGKIAGQAVGLAKRELKATKEAGKAIQKEAKGAVVARGTKRGSKVLQSGRHTTNDRTRKALGMSRERIKCAIKDMKRAAGRSNNSHETIMDNGD